jgi:hypothetical protein
MIGAIYICGVDACGKYGSSPDDRFTRLCSMHRQRRDRAVRDGRDPYSDIIRAPIDRRGHPPIVRAKPEIKLESVKEIICSDGLESKLRPLVLFRGSLREGRAKSLFSLLCAARRAEIPTYQQVCELTEWREDPAHFAGIHRPLQNMQLNGFLSRVLKCPTVLALESGLSEYVSWLMQNSKGHFLDLIPTSETSYRSKRDWRVVARPKRDRRTRERELITEYYPYIKGEPTSDHELILAVDQLVPKGLLNDVRADVCQDMIVAILTGEVTFGNLRDGLPKYLRQFMRNAPSKYGHLSLDAPAGEGRTLAEAIGL